jgi:hypothetical protein
MKTRPWPLIVIAVLHGLAPLMNIVLASWLQHVSVARYLQAFSAQAHFWDWISLLAVMPMAGVAIYLMKLWSYPFFLGVMSWTFYGNYQTWKMFPHSFNISWLTAIYAVNLVTVAYFLLPSVRQVYFDSKYRWWEPKPRYRVRIHAWMRMNQSKRQSVRIEDLSEGGAFVQTPISFAPEAKLNLQFKIFRSTVVLPVEIVYRNTGGRPGYGVRFLHTPETHRQMKRITRGLALLGAQPKIDSRLQWKEFVKWTTHLARTKDAWVPEIRESKKSA